MCDWVVANFFNLFMQEPLCDELLNKPFQIRLFPAVAVEYIERLVRDILLFKELQLLL